MMPRRRKQRPGDESLVRDESADPVERTSALMRLAADGRSDLLPVARAWLAHDDPELRSEALNMLFFWRVDDALPTALEMLARDPEPTVRIMAAACMSSWLQDHQVHKERILGELVCQLEQDSNSVVQRELYEQLLKHVAPGVEHARLSYHFDRDRDVDWQLLAPWRRH